MNHFLKNLKKLGHFDCSEYWAQQQLEGPEEVEPWIEHLNDLSQKMRFRYKRIRHHDHNHVLLKVWKK